MREKRYSKGDNHQKKKSRTDYGGRMTETVSRKGKLFLQQARKKRPFLSPNKPPTLAV